MPTYDYTCNACGNKFERFESITAAPNKACPKCGKKKAERQISAGGGFIFKGTGFYLTDYKKKSGTPAAESKPDQKSDQKKDTAALPAAAAATPSSGASSDTAPAPAPAPAPAKSSSSKSQK